MMEMSLAIKSPSVHYHLAGTKKVQQELAKPGVLEKFLGDKAKIESVRDIFTGLYSLDKARNNSFKSLKLVIIKNLFILRMKLEMPPSRGQLKPRRNLS